MFKKILEKAKNVFTKNGSKKFIERAAIVALIGVMFLIAGSVLFEKNPKSSLESETSSDANNTMANNEVKTEPGGAIETLNQSEKNLKNETELRLKAILSQISGAGKVDVMITFYSGNEFIPAADVNTSENNTQEKDKEGGSRVIKQTDKESATIYQEVDGVKKPFIIKEILPKVKGVVVVADGATDAEVKANLVKATEALLDIAVHKIQVFQRDSN